MIKNHYVAGFVFNVQMNKVVLIKKNRPKWQEGQLNGVGGHIEAEESPLAAMRREFEEETGIDTGNWRAIAKLSSPIDMNSADPWECWFFTTVTGAKPQTQTDEEVGWYPIAPLPENVIPNLHWLIPLALHGGRNWPIIAAEGL